MNNYSDTFNQILSYSKEEALRLNNDYIGPEHLMLGILRDGKNLAVETLQHKFLINISNNKEIDRFRESLIDRFGALPPEAENLFDVVRIRNLGGRLGFEKIIIKNGMMILFFISNPMSPYFKTKVFSDILAKVSVNEKLFNLKQTEGKLKIVSRGIDSLPAALSALYRLA